MANDKDEAWKKIKDGAKAAMDMAGQTAKEWKDEAEKTAKTLSEPGNSPRKKATLKKIGMGAALLLLIVILASFLSGPSLSCDDSEVKELVGNLVKNKIVEMAGSLNELAMIFEDPSSRDMQKQLSQLKNMSANVGDVQELNMNSKAKRCSCSANVTLKLGNLTESLNIRYEVRDTDKGLYVEIDPVSFFRQ